MMNRGNDQSRIFKRNELLYDEDDDPIGAEGFGVVYRCQLKHSSEFVALKILSTPHKLPKCDVADFIEEAGMLQRLTYCPHVIRFLGLCIDPGHYAIVMQYLEYGNLEDMLLRGVDKHSVIKQWDCRIRMALDIANGMNYLHSLPTPIIQRSKDSKCIGRSQL